MKYDLYVITHSPLAQEKEKRKKGVRLRHYGITRNKETTGFVDDVEFGSAES